MFYDYDEATYWTDFGQPAEDDYWNSYNAAQKDYYDQEQLYLTDPVSYYDTYNPYDPSSNNYF